MRDGYITWYNRQWYEYTGTTPEQMAGWGWQSVHDPEVLPRVIERWQASIATGDRFEMTFPLRGADGVFRPFLTRIVPLKDAQGKVVRWFGTNTDISVQKQVERELRKSQMRLDAIISSAMDAIISLNAEQRIVLFNRAAEKMFGVSAAEATGESINRFIPARFREAHAEHVEKFGHSGVTTRSMGQLGRLTALRSNGEEFPIQASISHIEIGGEKLFTVILRDNTQQTAGGGGARPQRAALPLVRRGLGPGDLAHESARRGGRAPPFLGRLHGPERFRGGRLRVDECHWPGRSPARYRSVAEGQREPGGLPGRVSPETARRPVAPHPGPRRAGPR